MNWSEALRATTIQQLSDRRRGETSSCGTLPICGQTHQQSCHVWSSRLGKSGSVTLITQITVKIEWYIYRDVGKHTDMKTSRSSWLLDVPLVENVMIYMRSNESASTFPDVSLISLRIIPNTGKTALETTHPAVQFVYAGRKSLLFKERFLSDPSTSSIINLTTKGHVQLAGSFRLLPQMTGIVDTAEEI